MSSSGKGRNVHSLTLSMFTPSKPLKEGRRNCVSNKKKIQEGNPFLTLSRDRFLLFKEIFKKVDQVVLIKIADEEICRLS